MSTMPKGRSFAPPTGTDGIWFHHRGLPEIQLSREDGTSTGFMLTAPFRDSTSCYPPAPPQPYHSKDTGSFSTSNLFSAHDNRHSFQDHGVYFEDGRLDRSLGRRLTAPNYRQHSTEQDALAHLGRGQAYGGDYHTVHGRNYTGRRCDSPPSQRRFPKVHPDPQEGCITPSTKTTSWFPDSDIIHKTPTHVLAVSQEPFLKPNRWKYSYHGLHKCYPPYERINSQRESFPSWLLEEPSDQSKQIQVNS